MNVESHYRSLADELWALQNRVRNFINESHWLTDGEWKESVLRNILIRHMPSNVNVGRGFVVTPDSCSSQIDILIYDSSIPTLYKEGDLVFVTADSVKAIIEVKSSINHNKMSQALQKLANNADLIKTNRLVNVDDDLFVGLFSYDYDEKRLSIRSVLKKLHDTANGQTNHVVNHLMLGKNHFIRFWHNDPRPDLQHANNSYNHWHSYIFENLSPGYFINNAIEYASDTASVRENRPVWYPPQGKEQNLSNTISL